MHTKCSLENITGKDHLADDPLKGCRCGQIGRHAAFMCIHNVVHWILGSDIDY